MRLHRKRKLIIPRKLLKLYNKIDYFTIIRINCNVFVCFYVHRNSCGYHRKNAYVCAANQNAQDTVNCLEHGKKHRYLTKMSMFSW